MELLNWLTVHNAPQPMELEMPFSPKSLAVAQETPPVEVLEASQVLPEQPNLDQEPSARDTVVEAAEEAASPQGLDEYGPAVEAPVNDEPLVIPALDFAAAQEQALVKALQTNPEAVMAPQPTAVATAEAKRLADLENQKRAFVERVMAARNAGVPETKTMPVHAAVQAQTQLEMAEGARMIKEHQARRAALAPRVPTQSDITQAGKNVPVFRPADHVPNPKVPDKTGTAVTLSTAGVR